MLDGSTPICEDIGRFVLFDCKFSKDYFSGVLVNYLPMDVAFHYMNLTLELM